jgi:hypothetical protein
LRAPVEEFLKALDSPGRDRAAAKIDLLSEMGTRLGPPHVKHIQGKLWELRVAGKRQIRILYFIQTGPGRYPYLPLLDTGRGTAVPLFFDKGIRGDFVSMLKYNPRLKKPARRLRAAMTDAEQRL